MGVCRYVAFYLTVNFLLAGNAHQMETRGEKEKRRDRLNAGSHKRKRERKKEISLKKRAVETGNEEEEERCVSLERLAYSC